MQESMARFAAPLTLAGKKSPVGRTDRLIAGWLPPATAGGIGTINKSVRRTL